MNRLIKHIFAAKNISNIIKKTILSIRDREIMIDDIVKNYQICVQNIDNNVYVDVTILKNSLLNVLRNIFGNYEIKNYIFSNIKTDLNELVNSTDTKLTDLLTKEFKNLNSDLPYCNEYLNMLFLFKKVSAKNLLLVDLNIDSNDVTKRQDDNEFIQDILKDYSSRILSLDDLANLYADLYSATTEEISKDRAYKRLYDKINSIDAAGKFIKEIIPLMEDDLINILKSFIDSLSEQEATNKLSRINLNPILDKYKNELNKWILNYLVNSNIKLDKDILIQFRNLNLDSVSIITSCHRLMREIRGFNMRKFQKLAEIKPIKVKLLGTDNTHVKGDSFYVTGLGIKNRDLAIVDYDGKLIKGLDHSEHHSQIMKRYDSKKEMVPLAWLEEYNDVIVVVALFGDIEAVKQHCLSEGYKKVVYYDPSDSLPDNNVTNKVILARRLFKK